LKNTEVIIFAKDVISVYTGTFNVVNLKRVNLNFKI